MSRDKYIPKRVILPDEKYNSIILSKFINVMMYAGKKSIARKTLYLALDNLMKANDLDSRNREIPFAIGNVYAAMKDGENSIKYFERVMKIDKRYSFTYLDAGRVYYNLMKDKGKTVEEARKAHLLHWNRWQPPCAALPYPGG